MYILKIRCILKIGNREPTGILLFITVDQGTPQCIPPSWDPALDPAPLRLSWVCSHY